MVATKSTLTVWGFFEMRKREGGVLKRIWCAYVFLIQRWYKLHVPGLTITHELHAEKEERFRALEYRAVFVIIIPDPLQPSFLLFQALQLVGGIYNLHRVWLFMEVVGAVGKEIWSLDGFVKPRREVGADCFEVRCVGKHFLCIVISASETKKDRS